MDGVFDFGIIILGLAALAFITGIVGWIWEFLANGKVQIPEQRSVESGITAPQPPIQKAPLPQSAIKQPAIPEKESTGFDVATAPLHSPHITEKPEIPSALSLDIQKPSVTHSSPLSTLKTEIHPPKSTKSLLPLSTHKKESKGKVSVTTSEVLRPVKSQAPLPEFGGMCNKCGQKPKVPGNDGFCSDCSELG